MYQEEILDHYKHPHHHGKIEGATLVQQEHNPLCGDKLTFYLDIKDSVITNVSFEGEGCAISQAAASMLTDDIIGKPIDFVRGLQKEHIIDMLGIDLGPTRLKCALLSLQGITRALSNDSKQAS